MLEVLGLVEMNGIPKGHTHLNRILVKYSTQKGYVVDVNLKDTDFGNLELTVTFTGGSAEEKMCDLARCLLGIILNKIMLRGSDVEATIFRTNHFYQTKDFVVNALMKHHPVLCGLPKSSILNGPVALLQFKEAK